MAIITSIISSVGAELRQTVASSRKSGSVRACLLTTRDREHAFNLLKESVCSFDHPLYHYTVAGRRRFDPGSRTWTKVGDGSEPTSVLTNAQELRGGGGCNFGGFSALLGR